jgi:hypothetical protein
MKTFTKIGAALFGLIALLHAARLVYRWEAVIGGLTIPLWASLPFLLIAGTMAWGLWKESR